MDAVPAAAAYDTDGAIYVSQLTGFPFPKGGANVYLVIPGQEPTVYASGFTNLTDLAFGRDGSLYAVQLTNDGLLAGGPGSVLRVRPGASSHTVIAGGLNQPYGIAVRGHSAYVTTCSTCAGDGQVVRLSLRRSS